MSTRVTLYEGTLAGECQWRLAWYIQDEDEFGLMLGEIKWRKGKAPTERGEWEAWTADRIAGCTPKVDRDSFGFHWPTKRDALHALARVSEALKGGPKRRVQAWERKALAAGWRPPK